MIVVAVACVTAIAVEAQVPPEADRTVSWYMHHRDALERVTAACRNDPGHGHNNPDCINADAARTALAAEEARQKAGLDSDTDPAYWRRHPKDIPAYLRMCAGAPPSLPIGASCRAARIAASER